MDRDFKKGQVTIFIIVAIILVVGIVLFFVFRSSEPSTNVDSRFSDVYNYYVECLKENSLQGISLLGEQAGYIVLPEFEPGSSYSPTSSQLNFFGQGVPYWMYLSGNNILKEQVPTKNSMQEQLSKYVSDRTDFCDFSEFEQAGYDVYIDPSSRVDVRINDLDVVLDINNEVTFFKDNSSSVFRNHKISIDSKLGKFYGQAKRIYDYQKENAFLEQYTLDVMRLYAPVDGSEISCKPLIFNEVQIKRDIADGISANTAFIKLGGNYYNIEDEKQEYFVVDPGFELDENVNFMYSSSWPTKIDIYGDMVVEPVGLQEGLSALGFCYVPYHFVYDIIHPVLIQFYDEENLFQFPVGVIIDKSSSREGVTGDTPLLLEESLCEYRNQEVRVKTSDINSNPVEAFISFECLSATCNVGETTISSNGEAVSDILMPQCVNGYIVARAEGYADSKYLASTNTIDSAEIFLNKKHNISIDLGNVNATVSFVSDDFSALAVYPEMRNVELIEGYYNITVYAYDSSSLVFPAIKDRKCVDVPESGLSGVLGIETEKCFDIDIPETQIDFAVIGGGKSQEYISENMLSDSREINIAVPLFGLPTSIQELQENNLRVEDERLVIDFE